jgi:hypothetical protein
MYDTQLGWAGSLTTMEPDKGYMYKAAAAATFTYPMSGLYSKSVVNPEQPLTTTWSVNESQYANSMNIVANLNCSAGQISNTLSLGAFVGAECRGVATISNTAQLTGMFYLTVFSNTNNETITYKLIDETNGNIIVLDNTSNFVNNTIEGSIANPNALLSSNQASLCEVTTGVNSVVGTDVSAIAKPNPFKDEFSLAVNLKTKSDVNIVVRSVTGQIVYTRSLGLVNKGNNEFNVNLSGKNIAQGVYSVEVITNMEIVNFKVVKF